MPTQNNDTWHANIKAKGKEIQGLIDQLLRHLPATDASKQDKFNKLLISTLQKCKDMHGLFGPNLIPGPLTHLTNELTQWQNNLHEPTHLKRIIGLYEPIGKINGTEEETITSFTAIFEKHREDESLQEFLAELIATLEQLLNEGDDILTKQAANELERILREIQKRKNLSLPDLKPWVEFAIVSAGAIVDHYVGSPIATIAGSAMIAAKNSQIRINELASLAYLEFLDSLELKNSEKYKGDFAKRLISAPIEAITAATQNPSGINYLPLHDDPITPDDPKI